MTTAANHLNAGFGIEIECFLPEGETIRTAANAVSHRLGAPVTVEGYNHDVRSTWKVVTDGSLGDISRGIEFVSPILRGEDGLAQVETVCRALSDFGCTVNKKCGLHVHVGVGAPGLRFFKNLVKLYSLFEPVIDSMMPASRRASNNTYCKSMTSARPSAVEGASSVADLLYIISGTTGRAGRYFKLNLQSFVRQSTVEFRQHSGTLDATKARRWAVLCLRMVAAAMGQINLGDAGPTMNRARPGTKAFTIGQMFLRPEGVSGREVMAATGWPSVSMPQQARSCGIEFTTQRMGREVRYYARSATEVRSTVAITIEGFATVIGAATDERAYMQQRVADLSGPVAWAA